jgi:hypothetical protein
MNVAQFIKKYAGTKNRVFMAETETGERIKFCMADVLFSWGDEFRARYPGFASYKIITHSLFP